jgi:alpha-galactosidase
MVEDYGADYIKLDYNQDCGTGTDYLAFCAGEGLEQCARAYLTWIDEIRARFPSVVFEACSSGGMRMDYETLSHFSICSTSDQTDYMKYPYIAGNILAGVLPEQAAVWSYPVGVGEIGKPLTYDAAWVHENITRERIVMNMINSVLGRMHLASHVELLSKDQLQLVTEGVACYHALSDFKKRALPYFPNGFCRFGDEAVCAGLLDGKDLYLAVWSLSDKKAGEVKLDRAIERAEVFYPHKSKVEVDFTDAQLNVKFDAANSAVLLKLSLD